MNGKNTKKTNNQRDDASATGGIFPNAPRAIAILLVMNIG